MLVVLRDPGVVVGKEVEEDLGSAGFLYEALVGGWLAVQICRLTACRITWCE